MNANIFLKVCLVAGAAMSSFALDASAAEYKPESWNLEAREKFAKPVKARYFRFVAPHALPVNDRLAVAEVDVM